MRKRMMLLAAPFCVVAIAASVAVAAPSGAGHSSSPNAEKLHAERPTAATTGIAQLSTTEAIFEVQAKAIQRYVQFRAVTEYLTARMIQDILDFTAFRASQEAARSSRTVGTSVSSNSNPGGFLSCVRNRESGGNYGIYNAGGSGAAGAYQFLPGTWNSTAASVGRGDLVGVDPAQASPADQDALAQALYAQQGAAPWGGGC